MSKIFDLAKKFDSFLSDFDAATDFSSKRRIHFEAMRHIDNVKFVEPRRKTDESLQYLISEMRLDIEKYSSH